MAGWLGPHAAARWRRFRDSAAGSVTDWFAGKCERPVTPVWRIVWSSPPPGRHDKDRSRTRGQRGRCLSVVAGRFGGMLCCPLRADGLPRFRQLCACLRVRTSCLEMLCSRTHPCRKQKEASVPGTEPDQRKRSAVRSSFPRGRLHRGGCKGRLGRFFSRKASRCPVTIAPVVVVAPTPLAVPAVLIIPLAVSEENA